MNGTQQYQHDKSSGRISVTHVTIRQSISVLLFKLFLIDLSASLFVLMFHTIIFVQGLESAFLQDMRIPALVVFVGLLVLKLLFTGYIILLWLNEYYEIHAHSIDYHRGIIYRMRDVYPFTHIRSISINQGVIGKLFNFGTLILFEWDLKKNIPLQRIHNPMKYLHLLEELLPNIEFEKKLIRDKLIDVEED